MKAELIDYMGDDLRVVNAARVSFNKESQYEIDEKNSYFESGVMVDPAITISEKDKKLITYLANHGHWTPFSHPQVTIRETVPIFVARQRFKHMVGFTYNEVSRRYVDDPPEFYVPSEWRGKPVNAKQGSSEEVINELLCHVAKQPLGSVYHKYLEYLGTAEDLYNDMIYSGIAPEQARMVLPQSMYTSYYVTGSLAAWARAYKQRIDPHAQKEIQDLAKQWNTIIEPLFPVSWKALTE